jgi:hypothetical protein
MRNELIYKLIQDVLIAAEHTPVDLTYFDKHPATGIIFRRQRRKTSPTIVSWREVSIRVYAPLPNARRVLCNAKYSVKILDRSPDVSPKNAALEEDIFKREYDLTEDHDALVKAIIAYLKREKNPT